MHQGANPGGCHVSSWSDTRIRIRHRRICRNVQCRCRAGRKFLGDDRPGNDIRNMPFNGDAQACLKLCNRERDCRAWTFVKAGVQGPSAVCFLKAPIPRAVANPCCTSGVIRKNL